MISQILGLVIWHLPLVFKIFLVTNKDSRNVFLGMLVDLTHPFRNLGKRISVSDIIGDNDTVSTLVVGRSDSLESLLSGSIPDLELDGLSVNVDCSDFEIYTNGWHKVVMENVILFEKYE